MAKYYDFPIVKNFLRYNKYLTVIVRFLTFKYFFMCNVTDR